MRVKSEYGTLSIKDGWITCPVCRRNRRLLRITPTPKRIACRFFAGTARRKSFCISSEARALNAGAHDGALERAVVGSGVFVALR